MLSALTKFTDKRYEHPPSGRSADCSRRCQLNRERGTAAYVEPTLDLLVSTLCIQPQMTRESGRYKAKLVVLMRHDDLSQKHGSNADGTKS